MEGRKNQCQDVLQAFQQQHPKFFRQPIIQSFLQNGTHQSLVRQAICFPTKQNKQAVDDAFQSFYGSVKALTYLSNVIHYHAINFDKTVRKQSNWEILMLDQPLQEENEETTHKDMLYQPAPDIADRVACETMADYVADPPLYRGNSNVIAETANDFNAEICTWISKQGNSSFIRGFPAKRIETAPKGITETEKTSEKGAR